VRKKSLTFASPATNGAAFRKIAALKLDVGLINRSIRASVLLAALVALYAIFFASPQWALLFAASALWNILNVYLWYRLLRAFLVERRKGSAILYAALKLPVLYAAGALYLHFFGFSLGAFLAGFNIVFVVLGLKLLGREYARAVAQNKKSLAENADSL
jgi:hypothetical protein